MYIAYSFLTYFSEMKRLMMYCLKLLLQNGPEIQFVHPTLSLVPILSCSDLTATGEQKNTKDI